MPASFADRLFACASSSLSRDDTHSLRHYIFDTELSPTPGCGLMTYAEAIEEVHAMLVGCLGRVLFRLRPVPMLVFRLLL